jgi:type VI secretion system ImpB/VipA family protein
MAGNNESTQHLLGRNRPPRVQITYDVEIGNAFEKKELPLVVGILADLSGPDSKVEAPKLGARPFINIDVDNFDSVLGNIKPGVSFTVPSKLGDPNATDAADAKLNVFLEFSKFEEFNPANIIEKVDGLREMFHKRQKLQDLLIKLDGDAALDKELVKSLASEEAIKQFKALLDEQSAAGGDSGKKPLSDKDPAADTNA